MNRVWQNPWVERVVRVAQNLRQKLTKDQAVEGGPEIAPWLPHLGPWVPWLRVLGSLSIVAGALYVLTLWGILVAWAPVLMGAMALQAAEAFQKAAAENDLEAAARGFARIGILIKVLAVFTALNLILGILLATAGLGFLALAGPLGWGGLGH